MSNTKEYVEDGYLKMINDKWNLSDNSEITQTTAISSQFQCKDKMIPGELF